MTLELYIILLAIIGSAAINLAFFIAERRSHARTLDAIERIYAAAYQDAGLPAQASVDAASGPHVVTVTCYGLGCGAKQAFTVTGNMEAVATSVQFDEKFRAAGWRNLDGADICPACIAKGQREAA